MSGFKRRSALRSTFEACNISEAKRDRPSCGGGAPAMSGCLLVPKCRTNPWLKQFGKESHLLDAEFPTGAREDRNTARIVADKHHFEILQAPVPQVVARWSYIRRHQPRCRAEQRKSSRMCSQERDSALKPRTGEPQAVSGAAPTENACCFGQKAPRAASKF